MNIQSFVLGLLKHGDHMRACKEAANETLTDEQAAQQGFELLTHPLVMDELAQLEDIRAQARKEGYNMYKERHDTALLTIRQKREILAQIATCRQKVGRYVKKDQDYVIVFEDPRPRDIVHAIELDNQLVELEKREEKISENFGKKTEQNTPEPQRLSDSAVKSLKYISGNNLAERLNEATKKDFNPGVKKEQLAQNKPWTPELISQAAQ